MYKEKKLSQGRYTALHSRLLTFETTQHNTFHLVNTVVCMCMSVCQRVCAFVYKVNPPVLLCHWCRREAQNTLAAGHIKTF